MDATASPAHVTPATAGVEPRRANTGDARTIDPVDRKSRANLALLELMLSRARPGGRMA